MKNIVVCRGSKRGIEFDIFEIGNNVIIKTISKSTYRGKFLGADEEDGYIIRLRNEEQKVRFPMNKVKYMFFDYEQDEDDEDKE